MPNTQATLTWRSIFDGEKHKGRELNEIAEFVKEQTFYRFLAFNGLVYFVNESGKAEHTGIEIEAVNN